MKERTIEEKIEFYLDPFEFLNKPRRVFMGLELMVDNDIDHTEEEKVLVKEIIKKAEKDFYEITLDKFDKKIRTLMKKLYSIN
jgi:hypothetical protein